MLLIATCLAWFAYVAPASPGGRTGYIVIHRVIAGSGSAGLELQGDNRTTSDLWRPKDRDVVGVAIFDIPKVSGLVNA